MVFDIQMNDMQPIDMRRRIRELQSIPDRDRTDAEWDELNELEIRTAPGNRDHDPAQDRQADRRQGTLIGQGRRVERDGKLQGNKSGNLLRQKPDSPPEAVCSRDSIGVPNARSTAKRRPEGRSSWKYRSAAANRKNESRRHRGPGERQP